jgi:hypothetical protein
MIASLLSFLMLNEFANALKTDAAAKAATDQAKNLILETFCDPPIGSESAQHDAVIVMLVPPDPTTNFFYGGIGRSRTMEGLESMKNIQDKNRAEVRLILDEADKISKHEIENMFAAVRPRKVCATTIRFRQFPRGFTLNAEHPDGLLLPGNSQWSWNYMHMIRFNFVDLLDPNIGMLAGFKYWMRMDGDTKWVAPIPDPFEGFDSNPRLGYLHNYDFDEASFVAEGLNQFTRQFAKRHGINLANVPAVSTVPLGTVKGYYNNLELGRVSMFQTPLALEYTKDIVLSNGIYKHRWGDALLRRVVVELTGMETKMIADSTLRQFRHCDFAPVH